MFAYILLGFVYEKEKENVVFYNPCGFLFVCLKSANSFSSLILCQLGEGTGSWKAEWWVLSKSI